jgi:uncharacterized membrane protein
MLVMLGVGLAAALLVGFWGNWAYAPALGWAAASVTYLLWVWIVIGRLGPAATAAHALREDPGRVFSDALVLTATVASFAGVGLILVDASNAQGYTKDATVAMALGSIALSWFLVHTLFTLRYAAIYYRDGTGVDFNEETPPRYADFAYLAFTVGMTFQVSDTNSKPTPSVPPSCGRHCCPTSLVRSCWPPPSTSCRVLSTSRAAGLAGHSLGPWRTSESTGTGGTRKGSPLAKGPRTPSGTGWAAGPSWASFWLS